MVMRDRVQRKKTGFVRNEAATYTIAFYLMLSLVCNQVGQGVPVMKAVLLLESS